MTDSSSTAADFAANVWVEVFFDPDPGFKLLFDGIRGQEELGRPFLYDVDMSSGSLLSDIGKIIGTSATIWLAQSEEELVDRYFNGIVTRVVSSGLVGGAYRYHIEVRPWIWLLTRVTDCRIFQSKSAIAIITEIFRDARLADFDDKRQAGSGEIELDYCVQYRETSFDFITRLMEQFGLYYYFRHERGRHTLVIADDPNSHDTLPDAIPFAFDQTELRTVTDHIWEWSSDLALQSGRFTFRDYNFTIPSVDLTARSTKEGSHPYGDLEIYEYPGAYDHLDAGTRLSDVRMQAIAMQRTSFDGASNGRGLHPGWRFNLEHHTLKPMNRDYLISRAQFSMALAEGSSVTEGETIDTYRVALRAIPGDVPYRLERLTRRPMIRGPQTAVVVGPRGDEICTDEYGRVKGKVPLGSRRNAQ